MKKFPLLFELAIALKVKDGLNGFYFIPLKFKGKEWDFRYVVERKSATVELQFCRFESTRPAVTLVIDSSGDLVSCVSTVRLSSSKSTALTAEEVSCFLLNAQKGLAALALCSPENKACTKLYKRGLIGKDFAVRA